MNDKEWEGENSKFESTQVEIEEELYLISAVIREPFVKAMR
jgi:hypothetical protein